MDTSPFYQFCTWISYFTHEEGWDTGRLEEGYDTDRNKEG